MARISPARNQLPHLLYAAQCQDHQYPLTCDLLIIQAAEVHILMVDRGKLDRACQLTAASVINNHTQVILDVMTAIIDDKVALFTIRDGELVAHLTAKMYA